MNKKIIRDKSKWKPILIQTSTIKMLKQYQLDNECSTYDQAINLMKLREKEQ